MGAQAVDVALATYSLPTLITVGSGKSPATTGFPPEAESVASRAAAGAAFRAATTTSEQSIVAARGAC